MSEPISKNNNSNDIGCLVIINDKLPLSSSIVINDIILNKEDVIGDEIISVNSAQTLILPQKPLQSKINSVSKSFNFLQLPNISRKKHFMFL